ncbi:MAG TPA: thiolase family protein [Chthonomonadaceae bacterium]|nr:thiolase family protein [Chthonomonadaceae bacterium]
MRDVVIVGAARTAIGKSPKGTLRYTRPDDLAAVAIRGALERAKGVAPEEVEDVILGCATPEAEQGLNVARVAALRAGLPNSVPGLTLNRFCASGLEAIATAAAKIATGQADIILAGGTESMSLVPFMGPTTKPNPYLMEHQPDTYLSMGLSVEGIAKQYEIRREQADAFSLESHQKALAAQDAGKFDAEIVPVYVKIQEGEGEEIGVREIEFRKDEGPRRDTSPEALAKLKPAFLAEGVITAGNASQRSDGAAAVVLMTLAEAERRGLKPLARFVGYAVAAVAPEQFGIAPAYAIPKLLKQTGLSIEEVDLIEFNEAFAAQVLAADRIFPLPMERVNVNGGAVALGHPLGATGARQTVTLLNEGQRRGAKYGLVTMCAALGMGAAGLFELG